MGAPDRRGEPAGSLHHEEIGRDERHHDVAREREIAQHHDRDFHTRDVRYFNDRERGAWREGRWRNDWHDGRRGWWYDVDGVWYAYPAPVYPYPLVVAPLIVEEAVGPIIDQPEQAYVLDTVAPLPALPRVAYHCGSPEGFYPAVGTCGAWVALKAH